LSSALGDIVKLGGLALQAEDCAIQAALHHRGEHGGSVHMENERYHQFVIWRAVLPIWHAVLERENSTDIIISRDGEKHYFELKNWRREDQFNSIVRDIEKLQSRENGYLLITAVNPTGQTDDNILHFLSKVDGLEISSQETYKFSTKKIDGSSFEYWIAGWLVIKSLSSAKF
jgi:hypothetical protein